MLLYTGEGDTGVCLLHYSEPVRITPGIKTDFILDPGEYEPLSLKFMDPLSEILQLSFPADFHQWNSYRLSLTGLNDFV